MESPGDQQTLTITYQNQRDVVIRVWRRRVLLRPRMVIAWSAVLSCGVALIVIGKGFLIGGIIGVCLVALMPFIMHRALARAVDSDPSWTDLKTVEFSETGIISNGPNWKSELPWARFLSFSEDNQFFYLDVDKNGIAAIIPKAAMTAEQQNQFREFAKQIPQKN